MSKINNFITVIFSIVVMIIFFMNIYFSARFGYLVFSKDPNFIMLFNLLHNEMGFNLNKYGGLFAGVLVSLVSNILILGPFIMLIKIEYNTRTD